MIKNILLTISYDGSVFHGWQRQEHEVTVQGYLEKTLSSLFNREIHLNGTSRTDAGVHAYGQRASFRADISIPQDRIAMVINNALSGREKGGFAISPVRILNAEEMPPEFHARFDSKGKRYIYKLRNSSTPDVFSRNYLYHIREKLNEEAMREASTCMIGTHDFKSFEASGSTPRETTVRTIYGIEVITKPIEPAHSVVSGDNGEQWEKDIELHVSGDGFLYNMVRIITGTLVEVGLGRISPESVSAIIAAKDRREAGHTAPPYGLYLDEVFYNDRARKHRCFSIV